MAHAARLAHQPGGLEQGLHVQHDVVFLGAQALAQRLALGRTWADHHALRQRRWATLMTSFTAGCQAGISANASSATQSISASGTCRAISEMAGSMCTRSPRDDVRTMRMRVGIKRRENGPGTGSSRIYTTSGTGGRPAVGARKPLSVTLPINVMKTGEAPRQERRSALAPRRIRRAKRSTPRPEQEKRQARTNQIEATWHALAHRRRGKKQHNHDLQHAPIQ